MKTYVTYIFVLLGLTVCQVSAQEYEWVKFMQGSGSQTPVSLEVAADGSHYAAFAYSGPSTYDSTSIAYSGSNQRACLIKQDSAGKTKWLKLFYATNSYVWILGTALSQNGELLILFTSNTDVHFDSNTIAHPGGGDVVFMARFAGDGSLQQKQVLLKSQQILYNASNPDGEAVFIDDNNDLYFYLNCQDTLRCYDSTGITLITPGLGNNRLVQFTQAGSKFGWVRSIPSTAGSIKRVDTDQQGKVYLAFDFYGSASFSFGGNTVSPSHNPMGAVFVLNNQGQDLYWFGITASGGQSSIHDLSIYDDQSFYISGEFLGDSALFDTLWKKTPVKGAYHFIARYESDGSLIWIKHEDTTLSTFSIVSTGNHSMTQYFDEYIYISYQSASAYTSNKSIIYDGTAYPALTGISTNGMNMKLDARGNILWAYRTQRHFPALGNDLASNLYFAGSWFSTTFQLGSYQATHQGSGDAFIGKTFDYAIFRGNISQGPYCAGDTLFVPYTIRGQYGDSNQFIAELSDENGLFTGGQRELGSIPSKDSGTISCTLPLFEVAGSSNYRIRVRSTQPFVQSFYRLDTLLLLIYSRDKANPGPQETICLGDTLMLNTFGGTRWAWNPTNRMNDSSKRQPLVWPDTTTEYRIIISDSSGCGETDTAYKTVIVRTDPSIQADFTDTLACSRDSIILYTHLSGGDTQNYRVRWYRVDSSGAVLLGESAPAGTADSLRVPVLYGDTSGKSYRAVLDDNCSILEDSVDIRVRSFPEFQASLPFSDTTVCRGSALQVVPQISGGRSSTYWVSWTDSLSLQSDTSPVFLDTINNYHVYLVHFGDACSEQQDSAMLEINVFDSLRLELGSANSIFNDTLLCPGAGISLGNRQGIGNNRNRSYVWRVGAQVLSTDSGFLALADSLYSRFGDGLGSPLSIFLRLEYGNGCETLADSIQLRIPGPAIDQSDSLHIHVPDSFHIEFDFVTRPAQHIKQYLWYRIGAHPPISIASITYPGPGIRVSISDSIYTLDSSYCYLLQSIDSCGQIAASDTLCSIHLKGLEGNQAVQLEWNLLNSPTNRQFVLLWNGSLWDTLASLSASTTQFAESNLACNIPRIYRVVAETADGKRHSSSDPITLLPFDTIPPQAPVLKAVSVLPNQQIELSWYPGPSPDINRYEVWKEIGGNFQLLATVFNDTVYTDNIANGHIQRERYYLIGIDSCHVQNRSAPSDTVSSFRLQLETGACQPQVEIRWDGYTDFDQGNITYRVWRNTGMSSFEILDSTSGNSLFYTDTRVNEGNYYGYRVEALDRVRGLSAFSDTAWMLPWVFPAPDMGKLLLATVQTSANLLGEIRLEWMKWDMSDSFARGYYLWHNDGTNTYLIHTENNLNTTSYVHDSVNTTSALNRYSVNTFNLCPDSLGTLYRQSENSDVHQPVLLIGMAGNLRSILSWSVYQGFDIDHYEIWREKDNAGFEFVSQRTATDTNYNDTLVQCGHTYQYEVRAFRKFGSEVSHSNTLTLNAIDTIPPKEGDIYSASVLTSSAVNGEIGLVFGAAPEQNRHRYLIYRSVNGANFQLHDSILTPSSGSAVYTDAGLNTLNNRYSYMIRVKDSCGNAGMQADTHTVVLLDAQALNNLNRISWSPYQGFDMYDYDLERRVNAGVWQSIAFPPMSDTLFMDSAVSCQNLYAYRLVTHSTDGIYTTLSNEDTAIAYSLDPPQAPGIVRSSVSQSGIPDGRILIEWLPSPSSDVAAYVLQRSTDGITWLDFVLGRTDSLYEDVGLNTMGQTYFYRIHARDSCGNQSLVPSNIHAASVLSLSPDEEKIILNWTAYQGWNPDYYRIIRDGVRIDSVMGNFLSYTDSPLTCLNEYLYQIEAVATNASVYSGSNEDAARPFDTRGPQAPELLYVTVVGKNEAVELAWTRPADFDLQFYEVENQNGKILSQLNDPNDTLLLLPQESMERPLCFAVRATDQCGNQSEWSNRACVIFPQVEVEDVRIRLSWDEYSDWAQGISHYEVYRSDDSMNWIFQAEVPNGIRVYYDDDLRADIPRFVYQVIAVSNPNRQESASSIVSLNLSPQVWIPTGFTPRVSAGLNDVFAPEGAWIAHYEMKIFNRWGALIFATENSQGWDGTLTGIPAPEGVYIYLMVIHGLNGERFTKKGSITLLR